MRSDFPAACRVGLFAWGFSRGAGGTLPFEDAEQSLYDAKLTGAIAIVMGTEGKGLRRLTKENCDLLVKIPMRGTVESLNVSVATGIFLYEAARGR